MPDDVIFEDPRARLRVERHGEPPPGFVELLERVVWGTGAVRYTMRDVAERLRAFQGSHFLALRQGDALAGTYVLAPRTLRLAGRAVPALYRTLLAVAPDRARAGLGEVLVREARRHFLGAAAGPLVLYGFIEAENAGSLALATRAGYERWSSFVAAPFTRWSPRDDPRVEPLAPEEIPALAADLQRAHSDQVAWDFEAALRAAPCLVFRRRSAVVAAAQVVRHRWRLDGLPGASGFVARSVLPRLPGARRLVDPSDLRFAFFGGLHAAPGHEPDLARLLEAALARAGLHAAMAYLDPRGRPYAALRSHGGLGLLHGIGVRPKVQVMASAVGLSSEERAAASARPLCPTIQDDV